MTNWHTDTFVNKQAAGAATMLKPSANILKMCVSLCNLVFYVARN